MIELERSLGMIAEDFIQCFQCGWWQVKPVYRILRWRTPSTGACPECGENRNRTGGTGQQRLAPVLTTTKGAQVKPPRNHGQGATLQ